MGAGGSTLPSDAPSGRKLAQANYKKNPQLAASLYENYTILFNEIRQLILTKLQAAANMKKRHGLFVPFDKNSPTEDEFVKTKSKLVRQLGDQSERSTDDDSESDSEMNVEQFRKNRRKYPVSNTTLFTSLKTEIETDQKWDDDDETTTMDTFFTDLFSTGIGGKITKFIGSAIFGSKTLFGGFEMYTKTVDTMLDSTLGDKLSVMSNLASIHMTLNPTELYSIVAMLGESKFAGKTLRSAENFQKLYQSEYFFELLSEIMDPALIQIGKLILKESTTYKKDFDAWPTFVKGALTKPVEELLRLFILSLILTFGEDGFDCLSVCHKAKKKTESTDRDDSSSEEDSSEDETLTIEEICKSVRDLHSQLMMYHGKFSENGQQAIAKLGKLRNADTVCDFE